MKKTVALAIAMFNAAVSMVAQKLPSDTAVIVGKLDNGITYYIRHNSASAGQASFHLVHNIGALAEKTKEYGAAHFLEHLMFQGTRRFPDQTMVKMLERNGVIYGHDINARTSDNETVYTLTSVPTRDSAFLDSCMMVMADWSHAALLEDSKVEHERSVILEEMNMRNTPERKLQGIMGNALMEGSRYVDHDILGTEEFVRTVSPALLRSFYRKWHRPDLEAVIVVGDFDAREMERRLRRIMGEVPKAKGKCPLKDPYQFSSVPDQKDVRLVIACDPAARAHSVMVVNRLKDFSFEEKDSEEYLRFNVVVNLFNVMAGKRAAEATAEQGSPFLGASFIVAPLKRGYLTYQLGAGVSNGAEARTLRMLLMEEARMRKEGFTQAELDWGKRNLRKVFLRTIVYRDQDNETIAKQLENVYLDGEPLVSNEDQYRLCSEYLDRLTLEELNGYVRKWAECTNKTIAITKPSEDHATTMEDVRDMMESIDKLDFSILPYEMPERPVEVAFMDSVPDSTTIVDEQLTSIGKRWTLANGVRVYYRHVEADKSKVCLRAVKKGGMSVYEADRIPAAEQAPLWVLSSGAGRFGSQDIYQQLELHGISIKPSILPYADEFAGSATPDEAESLFQLMHLYLTTPRLNATTLQDMRRMTIERNSNDDLQDTIRLIRSNHSPRTWVRNYAYFDLATADLAIRTWQEKFGRPALFDYIITGNISESEARRLAETYLSFDRDSDAMPALPLANCDMGQVHKDCSRVVKMNIGREFATVACSFNLDTVATLEHQIACRIIAQAFQTRCMQNIREKEGGVYAITVTSGYESTPAGHYEVNAEFNCKPHEAERLKRRLMDEWSAFVQSGISEEEYLSSSRHLDMAFLKDGISSEKWAEYMAHFLVDESPVLTPDTYVSASSGMTRNSVNAFLRMMDDCGYKIDVCFLSGKK